MQIACYFVNFMDFSRESGDVCTERRSSIYYAFIMQAEKSSLKHLEKREKVDCKMFRNTEKSAEVKKKAPIFRLVLRGGDEGDRTPYLLNAIQALSQVSYTPTGLPVSLDRLLIISNPRVKCQYPILKNFIASKWKH